MSSASTRYWNAHAVKIIHAIRKIPVRKYDLTTVDLTSTGTRVAGGYMGGKTAPFTIGGEGFAFAYQLGQTIAGVSDTLTLAVRSGSANGDVSGLLKWYDL